VLKPPSLSLAKIWLEIQFIGSQPLPAESETLGGGDMKYTFFFSNPKLCLDWRITEPECGCLEFPKNGERKGRRIREC
jgi:hypothetical protein